MSCPYRKIAAERWPRVEINGTGRWALLLREHGAVVAVYLTPNAQTARDSQSFYDSKVIDLQPTPFDRIRDVYDPEEKRRERRERAEQ